MMANRATILRWLAWAMWAAFVVVSAALWIFAEAIKRDVYFVRHFQHYPKGAVTVLMTSQPIWIACVPLLWLPFVLAYQRRSSLRFGMLLLLMSTMFGADVTLFVLILCAGPGLQM